MQFVASAYSILVVVIYAAVSGLWVDSSSDWYNSLNKPFWQPPNFVFGLIWPYNFFVLALAGVQVSLNATISETFLWMLTLTASVVFASAWSWDFYRTKNLVRASVWLCFAALTTLGLLISISNLYPAMFWWLFPYQIWLTIAASLSAGYAYLNRK
ncbi:MAG: hypothetical protein RLZZ330_269 [Actinomycetota bacterium]|jgi:tryptophan-rich sensory protein